jgi:hypothetical protein
MFSGHDAASRGKPSQQVCCAGQSREPGPFPVRMESSSPRCHCPLVIVPLSLPPCHCGERQRRSNPPEAGRTGLPRTPSGERARERGLTRGSMSLLAMTTKGSSAARHNEKAAHLRACLFRSRTYVTSAGLPGASGSSSPGPVSISLGGWRCRDLGLGIWHPPAHAGSGRMTRQRPWWLRT